MNQVMKSAAPETLDHVHESPQVMLVPLYVLAAGSIAAGFLAAAYFIGHDEALFWGASLYRAPENRIIDDIHSVPGFIPWVPTIMMVLGLALAYLFYIRYPALPGRLSGQHEPGYRFLLNKWYFDELYDIVLVRPAMWLGRAFWKQGDGAVIDGLGPDGVSARVVDFARGAVALQTGYVFHYAFAMLIGVAALVTWFMFAG